MGSIIWIRNGHYLYDIKPRNHGRFGLWLYLLNEIVAKFTQSRYILIYSGYEKNCIFFQYGDEQMYFWALYGKEKYTGQKEILLAPIGEKLFSPSGTSTFFS